MSEDTGNKNNDLNILSSLSNSFHTYLYLLKMHYQLTAAYKREYIWINCAHNCLGIHMHTQKSKELSATNKEDSILFIIHDGRLDQSPVTAATMFGKKNIRLIIFSISNNPI